jgi:ABC-type transport system involved in multi-copper enzyme maturation permease subunit
MTQAQVLPRRRSGLFKNPVALKELRGRMRGARAFAVLSVYLLLMVGFALLLYVLSTASQDVFGFTSGGQIGRTLFTGIVGIQLFLVTFIAPAFTASAISGERERQTYDLLKTTLLPARTLVIGKLFSALAYVFLLLIAAIPLQSIAFLFGGITEVEVILAFVILAVTAITLGATGLYFSATQARTLSANITTYGVTLFITVGLPMLIFIAIALFTSLLGARQADIAAEVQVVLLYGLLALSATNPLVAAFLTQYWLLNKQSATFFYETVTSTTGIIQVPLISPWIVFCVVYLLIALVLVVRTIGRVRRIEA